MTYCSCNERSPKIGVRKNARGTSARFADFFRLSARGLFAFPLYLYRVSDKSRVPDSRTLVKSLRDSTVEAVRRGAVRLTKSIIIGRTCIAPIK